MKKFITMMCIMAVAAIHAQEMKLTPQITVSGEGKIKVTPDQVMIHFGVQNTGKDAAEVKKLNDETVDKILKFIKKSGIEAADYQTKNVSLYKGYDYEKKKHHYVATQNFTVLIKDIKKYDSFMIGLVDMGINQINNIEFKSSEIEKHKTEARKKAVLDAQKKAADFVSVLDQKIGKVLMITDNSSHSFPPMYQRAYKTEAFSSDMVAGQETLAVGEIEIVVTISVSFQLD